MVSVVNGAALWGAHNEPVHTDVILNAIGTAGAAGRIEANFTGSRVPLPLHEPIVISGIDKRDLALRQRYLAGIGIGSHCEPHSFAVVRVGQLAKAVADPIVMADSALHFNQVYSLQ